MPSYAECLAGWEEDFDDPAYATFVAEFEGVTQNRVVCTPRAATLTLEALLCRLPYLRLAEVLRRHARGGKFLPSCPGYLR